MRTLLSQNTTDITSMRAFVSLKEKFPTWEEVLAAPDAVVEEAIRVGGLAAIKTARMKAILQTLVDERGACCMEWLRQESTEAVKAFLGQFKGIGPKTMSCVLMFNLCRPEFPVDTHVHRITASLGWCPQKFSREESYEHLNARVPDDCKFNLHVLLVEHGKICAACSKSGRGVDAVACPLAELKRGKKGGGKVSGKRKAADEKESKSPKAVKVEGAAAAAGTEDEKVPL